MKKLLKKILTRLKKAGITEENIESAMVRAFPITNEEVEREREFAKLFEAATGSGDLSALSDPPDTGAAAWVTSVGFFERLTSMLGFTKAITEFETTEANVMIGETMITVKEAAEEIYITSQHGGMIVADAAFKGTYDEAFQLCCLMTWQPLKDPLRSIYAVLDGLNYIDAVPGMAADVIDAANYVEGAVHLALNANLTTASERVRAQTSVGTIEVTNVAPLDGDVEISGEELVNGCVDRYDGARIVGPAVEVTEVDEALNGTVGAFIDGLVQLCKFHGFVITAGLNGRPAVKVYSEEEAAKMRQAKFSLTQFVIDKLHSNGSR